MKPARLILILLQLPSVWAQSVDLAASLARLAEAQNEVSEDPSKFAAAKLRQAQADAAAAASSPNVLDRNEAHNLLGVIYLWLKRSADGLSEFMRIDFGAESPNRPVYQFNIGRAYEMTGMHEKAVDSYLQALSAQPALSQAESALLRVSAGTAPDRAMQVCVALLEAKQTQTHSADSCFDREWQRWKQAASPEPVFTFLMRRYAGEREFRPPAGTPVSWAGALDEIRDAVKADYAVDFTKAPRHDQARPEAEFVRLLIGQSELFRRSTDAKGGDPVKDARRAVASLAAVWALDNSNTEAARSAADLLQEFRGIEDRKTLILKLAQSVASRSELAAETARETWDAWSRLYATVGSVLGEDRTCRSSSNSDDPLYYWLRALDAELHGKGTKPLPVLFPKPDPATVQTSSSLGVNRHLADCYRDIGDAQLYHRFDDATKPPLRIERPFNPVEDKLEVHLRSMFYPGGIGKSVVQAALLQAMDTPERWGQGWNAFGERFASSQGTRIIRQNIAFGLDTALGQEPRYERSPYRSAGDRFKYSVAQTFICYSDRRTRQFAIWRVGSALAAQLISNTWRPRGTGYGDRRTSSALLRTAADLGGDTGSNLLREFLPRRGKTWARFLRAFL